MPDPVQIRRYLNIINGSHLFGYLLCYFCPLLTVIINGLPYTQFSDCGAFADNYGTGLAGRNGIPTLSASAPPRGGTNITVNASNSSGSATMGLVLVGASPLSLDLLGGKILVASLVQTYMPVPANGLVLPYSVPSGSCRTRYGQVLQLDVAASAGVAMSPGLRLGLGK